jgi:hypothetical protein
MNTGTLKISVGFYPEPTASFESTSIKLITVEWLAFLFRILVVLGFNLGAARRSTNLICDIP